jgi:hypothetical protein
MQRVSDEAVAEGLRIIGLLHELVQRDPNSRRKKIERAALKLLRSVFD